MKVLYSWLKEFIPDLNETAEVIAKRLTDSGIEIDSIESLPSGDSIIELDLTPNRSDCLSIWGAAYEVGAVFGYPVRIPSMKPISIVTDSNQIVLEALELCPYYLALKVDQVKIGPSPSWMRERLEALGMRSINNIVDITNYVMMETGQPLHAFDYDSLDSHTVVVRTARPGERLQTLDGQTRELPAHAILICDPNKPIGVGGVMGGLNSEVSPQTKSILFEAAYFERRSIRRTAKALDLRSEAAIRFEKGVDPSGLLKALNRVMDLVIQLNIGKPNEQIISGSFYEPKTETAIHLRRRYLDQRIGLVFSQEKVEETLKNLNFQVETTEEGWLVRVPSRRQDVEQEVDLVEEVARLIGFDQIPAQLPTGISTQGGLSNRQKLVNSIHQILVSQGYHEAVNYSFMAKQDLEDLYPDLNHPMRRAIPLMNPMNESQAVMRTNLIPGLLRNLQYNQNHQNPNIALYELGRVYIAEKLPLNGLPKEETRLGVVLSGEYQTTHWMQAKAEATFYHLKGLLGNLFGELGWSLQLQENHSGSLFHPYQCANVIHQGHIVGTVGTLHPEIEKRWGLAKRVYIIDLSIDMLLQFAKPRIQYQSLPKYQAIYRDLALLVPKQVTAREVEIAIRQQGGDLLEEVKLFDVYTGAQVKEGYKSLAFSLTYRAKDRTLTDQEVSERHKEILTSVSQKLDSALRM
ncbi:Phenylalanine--tRNA ligase beta subunit [bioreactor metagenome]|uniref:Phenylalanine--tRNA ligase beta subunit n=1 Tax=bioreactor metagenome TaxID=1076179 RepID=A0A644ZDY6_9ZZZZ